MSTPRTAATSAADAFRELRVAIEHHTRGAVDIDDLLTDLCEYSTLARREQLAPERFVVAVKQALDALPAAGTDAPAEREAIKDRVVAVAIRTYFAH